MNKIIENPEPLAQLLAYQPHRLSPEELKQAVKDFYQLSKHIKKISEMNDDKLNKSETYFSLTGELNHIINEKYRVQERWDRKRLEEKQQGVSKPTYKHDDQLLNVLKPIVQDASESIINAFFKEADPTKNFETKNLRKPFSTLILQNPINPVKRENFPDLTDDGIVAAIENEPRKYVHDREVLAKDKVKDILFEIKELSESARNLDFFFKNRYFKQSELPDNPYSYENTEHGKDEFNKKTQKHIDKLVNGVIKAISDYNLKNRNTIHEYYEDNRPLKRLARYISPKRYRRHQEIVKHLNKELYDIEKLLGDLNHDITYYHPKYRDVFEEKYKDNLERTLKDQLLANAPDKSFVQVLAKKIIGKDQRQNI